MFLKNFYRSDITSTFTVSYLMEASYITIKLLTKNLTLVKDYTVSGRMDLF